MQHENVLLRGQTRVLEMIATGASLDDTLAALIDFIEAQEDDLTCSILIVADDGEHFRHSVGPSIPNVFHQTLQGAAITPPYLASCGEATHLGRPILVPDIANDERYSEPWRKLMLSCGLKAAYSMPVRRADGRVLASFAMYRGRPCDPSPAQPELIDLATHLASIALERHRFEQALRDSERRSRELLDALPVAVYTTDAGGKITYYNPASVDFAGRAGCEPKLGSDEWCVTWRLHSPDGAFLPHDACPMAIAIKEDRPIFGAEAAAERPDGGCTPFLAYPVPLHDASGKLVGAVNTLVDITNRKRIEQRLRESEEGLAAELAAAQRLQKLSAQLIQEDDSDAPFRQILDAATDLMHADMASLQMLDHGRGELHLLASKGFHRASADFWAWVRADSGSTCGAALAAGERIVAENVETCGFMAGTPDLEEYRRSGIQAVQTTPLVSRSGRPLGMISTHWREPHHPDEDDLRRFDVLARQAADLIERKRAEDSLQAQTRRLETINRVSKSLSSDLDLERIVQTVTDSATELSGAQFGSFFYNVTDEDGESYMLYTLSGAPKDAFADSPMPRNTSLFAPTFAGTGVLRLDNVREDPRFGDNAPYHGLPEGHLPVVSYLAVPVVSQSGQVHGGLFFGHDQPGVFTQEAEDLVVGIAAHAAIAIDNARMLQAARRDEAHRTLLLHELSHRVKNTLATVQAIALQTLYGTPSPAAFQEIFIGRLTALAHTHDLLMHSNWEGASIRDLVALELAPYRAGDTPRWTALGDDVQLDAKTALALGMAFHELATNAAKYGALSIPRGSAEVRWRLRNDGGESLLHIDWIERDGPPVAAPTQRGFGSRLLERGLKHELRAAVQIKFEPSSVRCAIEMPLAIQPADSAAEVA